MLSVVPDVCVCVDAAVQVTGNTLLRLPQASPCSLCCWVNAPCSCVWGTGRLGWAEEMQGGSGRRNAPPIQPDPHHKTNWPIAVTISHTLVFCTSSSSCLSLSLSLSRSSAPLILMWHYLPVYTHTHAHTHPYGNLSFTTLCGNNQFISQCRLRHNLDLFIRFCV